MKRVVLSVMGFFLMTSTALAGHPLVTDDTGTQGKGNGQVEMSLSFFSDKDRVNDATTFETKGGDATLGVTIGLLDSLDLVLSVPYAWYTLDENDTRVNRADGISDICLDVKWCFFEKYGWSLALKPGISLPAGNDDDGLGAGRSTYRMFLIGTKTFETAALHVNAGYIRNENNEDDRKDLWHASIAAEVEVFKNLSILANIGVERSPDPAGENHPAFILGGVSYHVSEKITLDAGVKHGLTASETDWTYLAGLTIRF